MRRVLLLCLLVLAAVPSAASAAACSGDPAQVLPIDIPVGGQNSHGLYALPSGAPRGLVVFGHGYGHLSESWRAHIARVARLDGVIAVAMDYRGMTIGKDAEGKTTARGWPTKGGAEDLIAVAQHFDRTCPGLAGITLYGVSMGASMTGYALAQKPRRADGRPLFDYWVAIEGAHNVTETYNEARLLAPANAFAKQATEDLEAEMGGTYEQKSDVFRERTNYFRAADIAASGIRGIVFVHAYQDGLVPYNQSVEMSNRMRELGIKTDFFSVGTRGSEESDTSIGGYAGLDTGGAGHGSEKSETHVVIMTGFDRLNALLTRGEPAPCNRDFRVNSTPESASPDPKAAAPGCMPDPLPPARPAASQPCRDRSRPAPVAIAKIRRVRGRVVLSGRAADRGCGRISRVLVAVTRVGRGRTCRFLTSRGRIARARPCSKPLYLRARGRESWRITLPKRLPRGRYSAVVRAVDAGRRIGPYGIPRTFRKRR